MSGDRDASVLAQPRTEAPEDDSPAIDVRLHGPRFGRRWMLQQGVPVSDDEEVESTQVGRIQGDGEIVGVEPPLDAERAVCNANADDVHSISGGDDLGRIPP